MRLRDSLGRLRDHGELLFVSVLLHSLLVLFPWQEKSRPVVEPKTPASPISVVDASQLPQLSTSDSQQLPIVLSEPVIRPPVPAVEDLPPVNLPAPLPPDAPVIEQRDDLTNDPALEESSYPDSTPTPMTSTAPAEASPTTPAVTPANEAKIAADWESFVGHLQLQDVGFESSTLLHIFKIYDDPDQTNQFFHEKEDEDEDRQPKLNVLSHYLFSEQTPEQIMQSVVVPGLSSDTSLKLQPQENFTAGLAHQLLQGEVLRYLIIVQFNGTNDSVLILSDSLPRDLTAE
ncbi:MAG: hypothetical protein AAFQ40_09950 [Cyanobacteria bacterium J06623_5]